MWIDLLKTVLPESVLIAAVAWLAKAITTHRLTKDVERFKSDLLIEATRDNTVFSRLHERRAEVIAEVYAALVAAENGVRYYFNPLGAPSPPPTITLAGVALDAMWRLQKTADEHRVWFMPDTAAKIDGVVSALRTAWNKGAIGGRYEEPNERVSAMIDESWSMISETVPELRATLESEFRDLLAVQLRPKTSS
jgi:hypothetical protein